RAASRFQCPGITAAAAERPVPHSHHLRGSENFYIFSTTPAPSVSLQVPPEVRRLKPQLERAKSPAQPDARFRGPSTAGHTSCRRSSPPAGTRRVILAGQACPFSTRQFHLYRRKNVPDGELLRPDPEVPKIQYLTTSIHFYII